MKKIKNIQATLQEVEKILREDHSRDLQGILITKVGDAHDYILKVETTYRLINYTEDKNEVL